MEQLANFKFCLELGKTATQANKRLQTVYANDASSHTGALRVKQGMCDRRMYTEQEQLQNATDPWMTHKLMENQLHVNRERTGDTIRENLENGKTCAKFAPYSLTDEQKEQTSSRYATPNHPFTDASFPEMSLKHFKAILKQNVRAGRGDKNNRREPCKSRRLKQSSSLSRTNRGMIHKKFVTKRKRRTVNPDN